MKKHLTFSNLLLVVGVSYLLSTMVPLFFSNSAKEGLKISTKEIEVIGKVPSDKKILFPDGDRTLAIFWATWCAPCKLEMKRLKSSVESGKIPAGKIIAINPFESTETVRLFLKENSYPFTFIKDDGISQSLNITRTPTTLFIEKNKVLNLSSGLSLTGIWKAENFL